MLVSENPGSSPDPENLIVRLNQIVVRKSQNLLTCLFKFNKKGFQDLLMLREDALGDKAQLDQLFQKYALMAKEPDAPDIDIDHLVKRILKVCAC